MGNGTLEITLGNKVVGSLVLSNSLFEELKEGHTLHADSVIAFNLYKTYKVVQYFYIVSKGA